MGRVKAHTRFASWLRRGAARRELTYHGSHTAKLVPSESLLPSGHGATVGTWLGATVYVGFGEGSTVGASDGTGDGATDMVGRVVGSKVAVGAGVIVGSGEGAKRQSPFSSWSAGSRRFGSASVVNLAAAQTSHAWSHDDAFGVNVSAAHVVQGHSGKIFCAHGTAGAKSGSAALKSLMEQAIDEQSCLAAVAPSFTAPGEQPNAVTFSRSLAWSSKITSPKLKSISTR